MSNGTLRFVHAKGNADVAAASIEDVVTGNDTQRVMGGTDGTVASLAAPYGTGSALPYENLIEQLRKKAVFPRVYRDGDRNANNAADLITLGCTVVKFKKGSETLRAITTVAGATSMTPRCEFMDKDGNSLLIRDITGKVRFFGGNLKATYDFAKKTAKVADENFSSAAGRS